MTEDRNHTDDPIPVAKALKLLRQRESLTQAAASRRDGAPNFRTLSDWENRRKLPSLRLLHGYLEALGLDFADFQVALDQVREHPSKARRSLIPRAVELERRMSRLEQRLRATVENLGRAPASELTTGPAPGAEPVYSLRAAEAPGTPCAVCGERKTGAGPVGYRGEAPICDRCTLDGSSPLGVVLAMLCVVRVYANFRGEPRERQEALQELGAFARIYDAYAAKSGPMRLIELTPEELARATKRD